MSEKHKSQCVCDVLQEIADAQDEINHGDCDTSCKRSINQLVGGVMGDVFDTIPVILYCKSTCKPFFGTGITFNNNEEKLGFSFFFRVKKVDKDTCCATLELLGEDGDLGKFDKKNGHPTIGDQNVKDFDDLEGTGICITVDLNCFCAVSCLDPVQAF